jgi:zinc/manganese transport system permease protein
MESDFLAFMVTPIAACLVLVGMHAWLGLQILSRGVIFVDLALAQLAALGASLTVVAGFELDGGAGYIASLGATLIGAALFSFTRTRTDGVPQEAIIGVVYVVAAAASIIVLDQSSHGSEHLKEVLVGQILWVNWSDVALALVVYVVMGMLHWFCRGPFLQISTGDHEMSASRVRLWDFLFYATFGIVITISVPLAGVLLVFAFLIVPALCAVLIASALRSQLIVACAVGFGVSVLGCCLSYMLDLPTGAAVVCTFGGALALLGISRMMHSLW